AELGHPTATVAERARGLGIDTAWPGADLDPGDEAQLRADLAVAPPVEAASGPAANPPAPPPRPAPYAVPWATPPGGAAAPGLEVPAVPDLPSTPVAPASTTTTAAARSRSRFPVGALIVRFLRFLLEYWLFIVFWGMIVALIVGISWFGHAITH
ncbi:MAG TPA: hypothetical protein VGM93_04440, partial [Acidimicrobiales bacterium]